MVDKNKAAKDQKDQAPEKSFWDRAVDFAKNSFSALAGAGVGALVGSAIPGLGTLVGAVVGAVVGRAVVEPAVKSVLNIGANNQETAAKTHENPENVEVPVASSTAALQVQLQQAPKPAPALKPEPEAVLAPKPQPGTKLVNGSALKALAQATAPKVLETEEQPSPTAASIFNPAGTPKLTAAPAA